jgi:tetratricopeptide (TPR) repeat protein
MSRALLLVAVLAGSAHADQECELACRVEHVRGLLARGETMAAREELVKLHAQYADPQLLFALGQVELKLGNFDAAIDYYERFIATNPGPDHVGLAQQGIGAARAEMIRPKPKLDPPPPLPVVPPAPPRFERRWDLGDTILLATGGASLVAGGVLIGHAYRLGNDTSGTLAEYDDRLEHAESRRITGIVLAGAGALAIGIAVARWRLDRTLVIEATPNQLTVSGRW